MALQLIPIVIAGANVVARVAPKVARSLMNKGIAKKASKKAIEKQTTVSRQPIKTMSEARAIKLAKDAAPKIGGKVPGKKLPRGGRKAVAAAGVGTAAGIASVASKKSKKLPEKEVGPPPKVTALIQEQKKESDPAPKKTTKADDPTEGGRFAFYPGQTSKDLGLMYEVDKNKMPDEIRERLEESELYEGDFKGGRVGKGKKKKVSKAPRGVRAAMRGFKTMKIGGKVGKRTKGTGGGWV